MTSHATLTYKRSLHSTSLCCSFHATHTLRLLTLHHSPSMPTRHCAHCSANPDRSSTTTATPCTQGEGYPTQGKHCSDHSLGPSMHYSQRSSRDPISPQTTLALSTRMRTGALTTKPFNTARQVSHPPAGKETDSSLSHHMYYTRRQARYPALTQQGVHQHMIQAALNKRASQAPIQSGRARKPPSRFITLQY